MPMLLRVSVIALAAVATPLCAEDLRERIDARFAELDTDHDGLLSRLECSRMSGLLESFLKHDADKDGKLDREEFGRAAAPLLAANRR